MKKFFEKFKVIIGAIISFLALLLGIFGWNSLNKKKTSKIIKKGEETINDAKHTKKDNEKIKEEIIEIVKKNEEVIAEGKKVLKESKIKKEIVVETKDMTDDELIAKNKEIIEKLKGKI